MSATRSAERLRWYRFFVSGFSPLRGEPVQLRLSVAAAALPQALAKLDADLVKLGITAPLRTLEKPFRAPRRREERSR